MSDIPFDELLKIADRTTPTVEELIKMLGNVEGNTEDEMAKIINERSAKTMTVADLKAMLKNMPDDAEITADENVIEKVTADIDLNGNIERVNLVLK